MLLLITSNYLISYTYTLKLMQKRTINLGSFIVILHRGVNIHIGYLLSNNGTN